MAKKKYELDFEAINAETDPRGVLAHYELLEDITLDGDEYKGRCPLGTKDHGKGASFAMNANSGAWNCQACKKRGRSLIHFVREFDNGSDGDWKKAAQITLDISKAALVENYEPVTYGTVRRVADTGQATYNATPVPAVGDDESDIQDILQLAREHFERIASEDRQVMSDPDAVALYVQTIIGSSDRECFLVICLNSELCLIASEILFTGTVNQTEVYLRDVARYVLAKNAEFVVVAHNHPSGNPKPSDLDLEITNHIRNGLEIFDIELVDHVIVGNGKHVSLAAQNKL